MHLQSILFGIAAILLIGLGLWLKPQPKLGALDRTRLAKLLLSEIELSYQTLVQQARSTGSIPDLLQSEISRARQAYIDRCGGDDPTGEGFEQVVGRWLGPRTTSNPAS